MFFVAYDFSRNHHTRKTMLTVPLTDQKPYWDPGRISSTMGEILPAMLRRELSTFFNHHNVGILKVLRDCLHLSRFFVSRALVRVFSSKSLWEKDSRGKLSCLGAFLDFMKQSSPFNSRKVGKSLPGIGCDIQCQVRI